MEYLSKCLRLCRGSYHISLPLAMALVFTVSFTCQDESVNLVSIEDSIDLDGGSSSQAVPESNGRMVNVQLRALPKHNTGSNYKASDDEDEDALTSGSGSGSGDNFLIGVAGRGNGNMTPTHTPTAAGVTSAPRSNSSNLDSEELGNETRQNITIDLDHTFADIDSDENSDLADVDEDSIYDLPEASSMESNHVLNPPSWSKWSDWFLASSSSKVRVRTCEVDGEEVSEASCDGVRLQMRSCDRTNTGQCGRIQDINTIRIDRCDDSYSGVSKEKFMKDSPSTTSSPLIGLPATEKPNPDICRYSLYDTYRRKYVFTGWNLTELVTKSKVKRWCDRSSGQYIVMSTPRDHCRQYYKDLCEVSQRCRSDRPTKERGDFAEGCWRNLVYGDMLPIGLSNKQTIVYFICQRFAEQSLLGKVFGYKDTHFGTLYDTNTRSPSLSLNKITRLGDETWPDTDKFIEHGLVESESDMLWLFRKPRKGMLSLRDLDRCSDDSSCELGLRQTLPHDYLDPRDSAYVPTHLMWPELMPPDPDPRLATFTMTNMAPLHVSLFEEWHHAIIRARQYAIDQCEIPVFLDSTFAHQAEFSTHRANKSAMYVASGVIPSTEPVMTTGRDIHVPFLFWLAGCCVKQHSNYNNGVDNNISESVVNYNKSETWSGMIVEDRTKNITAFSLYIRNSIGSHVIPAPVLQLEMLLEDIYKSTSSDPDVSLFPGHDSACSDLKNDVSHWFQ